jgi:asparagine synthase (glutamine-hydrolysing)
VSGISAVIDTTGRPVPTATINAITAAQDYRGPDGITSWIKGPVALGFCAMHSTAEALEAAQPLSSEDGSVILVMDGYLANHDELTREFSQRGPALRTRADAELVLRAYDRWGDDCAVHLEGEFAFVLWDARRLRALCGRDHVGLRPLHYHWDGTRLVVASDIAAVLAALPDDPAINLGHLAEVMANQWATFDETAWVGVMKLRPGHIMAVDGNGLTTRRYYELPTEVSIRHNSDGEYHEHYLDILQTSVRRASRTHLPLACEASGGLDSSAVLALALEMQRSGSLPAPDLRAYTFDSPPGSRADEREYAGDLARFLGIDIKRAPLFVPETEWFVRQSELDRDLAPFANTAMLRGLGVQLAADGCRVALNGQGGDHWLDGKHYYYLEMLRERDWAGLLGAFAADRKHYGIGKALRMAAVYGIAPGLPGPVYSAIRAMRRTFGVRPAKDLSWLAPELREELARRVALANAGYPERFDQSYKLEKLDHPFLPRFLEIFSRQNARLGYESRSPMLSRPFIEFCAATPERLRLVGGTYKTMHRKALAGKLPESILSRQSKAEFGVVYDQHFGNLEDLFAGFTESDCEGLVSRKGIAGLRENYCNATIDTRSTWEVWGTYCCLSFKRGYSPSGHPG